jgi:hypothetical protein
MSNFFGGNFDYTDSNDNEWHNLPHDPDDKPGGDMGEIFSDFGWSTWGDFYDDKLGLSDDNQAQRPPILDPDGIDGVIRDFYGRGILDWAMFQFRADGFIDYTIDADT